MRKQLIKKSLTKDLFIIYDKKQCFYVVSIGEVKINKNGDITSKNVLYSSKHLNDCLNYFNKDGKK